MELKSKPSQPDNAEKACKCNKCGNTATLDAGKCDVCGQPLPTDRTVYTSNEDY